MAKQSGKGISLIILGIVAIIAIVGLVLLFTGANKSAVGEFALPAAKEYGGAIKGSYDPYSRAFNGRANEFPSGQVEVFSAQWPGSSGVMVGGESFGDTSGPKGAQSSASNTYSRAMTELPSKASCQFMAIRSNKPQFVRPASVQQAQSIVALGKSCVLVEELASEADVVAPNAYGRSREVLEYTRSIGVRYCCEEPGMAGLI